MCSQCALIVITHASMAWACQFLPATLHAHTHTRTSHTRTLGAHDKVRITANYHCYESVFRDAVRALGAQLLLAMTFGRSPARRTPLDGGARTFCACARAYALSRTNVMYKLNIHTAKIYIDVYYIENAHNQQPPRDDDVGRRAGAMRYAAPCACWGSRVVRRALRARSSRRAHGIIRIIHARAVAGGIRRLWRPGCARCRHHHNSIFE